MCSEVERTHIPWNCGMTTDRDVANTQNLLLRGCSRCLGYIVKMLAGTKFFGIPIQQESFSF